MVRSKINDLTFVVPPENGGQIVEVSYAYDTVVCEIVQRTHDRSPRGTTTYRWFEDPDTEDWDPQNGAPDLGDPTTAPMTRREADASEGERA